MRTLKAILLAGVLAWFVIPIAATFVLYMVGLGEIRLWAAALSVLVGWPYLTVRFVRDWSAAAGEHPPSKIGRTDAPSSRLTFAGCAAHAVSQCPMCR
jgi:hypothetical protein